MNKNHLMMLAGLTCGAALCQAQEGPWRVRDALGLPTWLQLSFEHRTRYETLDEQFRAGGSGGDQVVALRTLALMEVVFPEWRVGGELIDSRLSLADAGTPVDTTQVNTAELLQAYAAWTPKHFLGSAASADIRFGRQTMDVGYRRLVARNSFRNTINAFTGLDAKFDAAGNWHARVFYVLPVARRPDDVPSMLDEEAKFDLQDFNTQFWGLFSRKHQLGWGAMGEVYVFGLHEEDGTRLATRDRELYTPGFRVYREPAKAQFDFELESIYQFGESRASTAPTDVIDLDHFAHMQHAQAGYTFDAPWSPRVLVQYDYASGDEDPFDGDNERFDTLFGARRWEFGPNLGRLRPQQHQFTGLSPDRQALRDRLGLHRPPAVLVGLGPGYLDHQRYPRRNGRHRRLHRPPDRGQHHLAGDP